MRGDTAMKKYKYSQKKILEKIYVKSREILDIIIDDYDKYFMLFNCKDNYITAVEILLWSIEYTLDIKIFDEENYFLFSDAYKININYDNESKTDISNRISYNFEYGNIYAKQDFDLIDKYINKFNKENNENKESNIDINNNSKNNNLCLMSITNLDQMHKSERLPSDARNKNYKAKYNFKLRDKSNNITDYFDNTQDISAINKLNTIN